MSFTPLVIPAFLAVIGYAKYDAIPDSAENHPAAAGVQKMVHQVFNQPAYNKIFEGMVRAETGKSEKIDISHFQKVVKVVKTNNYGWQVYRDSKRLYIKLLGNLDPSTFTWRNEFDFLFSINNAVKMNTHKACYFAAVVSLISAIFSAKVLALSILPAFGFVASTAIVFTVAYAFFEKRVVFPLILQNMSLNNLKALVSDFKTLSLMERRVHFSAAQAILSQKSPRT